MIFLCIRSVFASVFDIKTGSTRTGTPFTFKVSNSSFGIFSDFYYKKSNPLTPSIMTFLCIRSVFASVLDIKTGSTRTLGPSVYTKVAAAGASAAASFFSSLSFFPIPLMSVTYSKTF